MNFDFGKAINERDKMFGAPPAPGGFNFVGPIAPNLGIPAAVPPAPVFRPAAAAVPPAPVFRPAAAAVPPAPGAPAGVKNVFSQFVNNYFTPEEAIKHTNTAWKTKFLIRPNGQPFDLFRQITNGEEQSQLILDIHNLMDVIIKNNFLCSPSKYGSRMFRAGKFRFFNPDNEFMPIAKKTGTPPCDTQFSHYNEAFWFSKSPLPHYMFNPKYDIQSSEQFGTIMGVNAKDKSNNNVLNFILDFSSRQETKIPGNRQGILCSRT
jgi:hypothetical protein